MPERRWLSFSGAKLRYHRNRAGYSVMRLCREIEFIVGPGAISRYETGARGKRVPDIEIALRIARVLGCKIEDLTENDKDAKG